MKLSHLTCAERFALVAFLVLALLPATRRALATSLDISYQPRVVEDWNDDWSFAFVAPEDIRKEPVRTFKRWDEPPREKTGEPRTVRLPHDWAHELGFDPNLDGATGKAKWRGVGIYSKNLVVTKEDADRRFVLALDGAASFPEVCVNGKYAGGWDYAYLGCEVDLTRFLREGDNLIEIRCDSRPHWSRWYLGGGLYRGVKLIKASKKLWLPQGSVVVKVENVQPKPNNLADAEVSVSVAPECRPLTSDIALYFDIYDPVAKKVLHAGGWITGQLDGDSKNSAIKDLEKFPQFEDSEQGYIRFKLVDAPIWDVDSPRLLVARVSCYDLDKNLLDAREERFGVRKIEWTVDDGFHLNGRRLQLNGVDLHHDQGLIGACSHPAAVRRQLKIMRDMGVNAIRTSHNPNSSAFMDACDELGLVVWNELFDKWDGTAGINGDVDFFEFTERQARQFVRRDRNRPSVCAWSIGNEIWDIESNVKGNSNPNLDARKRVQWARDVVKKYDPTRLVGLGCFVESAIGDYPPKNDVLAPLDIMGWNYGAKYRVGRASYPDKPVVYTESCSAFSTRGYYDLKHPEKKDQYDWNAKQVDSYDLISANGPRDIPDVDFQRMEEDRYVPGEFVWTGFDYLGEPAPFEKDANISYFGIVDLTGTPKDRFYLYRSHWNLADKTTHILPHWNWTEGQNVPVYVYTSGDSAELFLNGKSLGRKAKDMTRTLEKPAGAEFDLPDYYWIVDKYRLRWENVAFEPGVLEVVAYRDGKEIGRDKVETSSEPARLRATAEKDAFESDDDLLYVNVEAQDAEGRFCPTASTRVTVEVDGAAELAGFGTGDPIALDSFADDACNLFYGRATLVLRSKKGASGQTAKATFKAEGMPDVVVEAPVK